MTSDDVGLLDLSVDGHAVRFWAAIAVAITGATLLVGLGPQHQRRGPP